MKWLFSYVLGCAYVFGFLRGGDLKTRIGDREILLNVLVALSWPGALAFAVARLVFRGKPIRI